MEQIIISKEELFALMELANKVGDAESYRHWLANDRELTERLEKLVRVPEGAKLFTKQQIEDGLYECTTMMRNSCRASAISLFAEES